MQIDKKSSFSRTVYLVLWPALVIPALAFLVFEYSPVKAYFLSKKLVMAQEFTLKQTSANLLTASANAVDGLRLADSVMTLKMACDYSPDRYPSESINFYLSSPQPLPDYLTLLLHVENMEPTMQAPVEVGTQNTPGIYQRNFGLYFSCDLVRQAVVQINDQPLHGWKINLAR
jgi:hypothetical protein